MAAKGKIYALLDPRDDEVRYVGVTAGKLSSRLAGHMKVARSDATHHRAHWLRQLVELGLTPRIELIEEVPYDQRYEAEEVWVDYFWSLGCRLVNSTDGGAGPSGYHFDEVTRYAMGSGARGKTWSEERRAKTRGNQNAKGSRSRLGRINAPEHRANISAGVRAQPHVKCPSCDMVNRAGVIASHRKRRGH